MNMVAERCARATGTAPDPNVATQPVDVPALVRAGLHDLAAVLIDPPIGVTLRAVPAADLGACDPCLRDVEVGGAIFAFAAQAVAVVRRPASVDVRRVPVCPGHLHDATAEQYDHGRVLVAVELPTMPAQPPAPVVDLARRSA